MRQWMMAALLMAGVLAAGLNGCSQGKDEEPLVAEANSPVADFPIPAGFHMTSESRSSITPVSGIRLVEHYYKGKGGMLPTVRFYRDQLAAKGWALSSQLQVGGKVTLSATKVNEDLVITIWDGTFDTHIGALIYPADKSGAAK